MTPRMAIGPRRRRRSPGLRLLACAAAVLGIGLAPGCASGRTRWRLAIDSFQMYLEPAFNWEGTDPTGGWEDEWFEDRKGTLASFAVALPCGLELGAGIGSGDYCLGHYAIFGSEDGVRVWKAEAAWEFGSTNVLRIGARHEAVDDAHVLDYEPRPDEYRYDSSARTCYVLVGRAFGSVRIMAGVAHVETESSFLRHYPETWMADMDFGLSSSRTVALVSVDTPEAEGPVFGRLEGAFAPDDIQGTYWLSTSVGVTF